jgi:heme exporter protein D
VTYAFYCWLATAVVSIIGLILTLTSPIWDLAVNAATRQNNVSLQGTSVQSLINTLKIFTVVIALIFVAVYLLFAFKMYAGRNWARIVLTVFGALTLLSAFTPTSRSVTVGSEVYNINTGAWAGYVTALLALIGIVLMFLAPSNKYFAESKTYKQAKQQIRA